MEVAVAKALKPSLQKDVVLPQANYEEILCVNTNNVVVGEDFSVDDLLDFSNGEFQHGSVGKETDDYEEEEDEEKDSTSDSSQSQDRIEDDSNSNSTGFSGVAGDSDSIFAGGLAVPADDVADLEWVSHFVDDSLPELSLLYPVRSEQTRAWAEPEPRPGSAKTPSLPSAITSKPRTTKTRKPIGHVWSFKPVFSPAPPLVFAGSVPNKEFYEPLTKKQKKKPEAQTGGPQFQRRCSHCHVQKTPQWRTGPLGAKTLCNACGVRYKSGRLFPEYRPASSPTFSGDIHSNSHRKVLEIRRRKEMTGPESGSDHTQMIQSS
ncbi:GATA transcription factor 7-like [Gastrolobium bilobum]|uniref:GATA transcription factor 7-like n=1 Tax=Gastrolobium bilobum TaxID=150636 RepID=UPI002AB06E0E|nr:GATA transcription factor 7-like [Gastrolobium bilobum]XP_061340607.1 GATA transcription factor 7-like [Gastrolobium bilobum]